MVPTVIAQKLGLQLCARVETLSRWVGLVMLDLTVTEAYFVGAEGLQCALVLFAAGTCVMHIFSRREYPSCFRLP